jgi:hypothetical protein
LGSGVGVAVLSGRKMVLNPWPVNVPVKAASGPRLGSDELAALNDVELDTSPNLKPLGSKRAVSSFVSPICSILQPLHVVCLQISERQ